MEYVPPKPADLQALKNALGFTGKQMAALACVGEQHWRKYTGGATPRSIDFANLFHMAALLELSEEDIARIYQRMRDIGATVGNEKERADPHDSDK
jgi:transcriptional regulator with XRE-family HTH domain